MALRHGDCLIALVRGFITCSNHHDAESTSITKHRSNAARPPFSRDSESHTRTKSLNELAVCCAFRCFAIYGNADFNSSDDFTDRRRLFHAATERSTSESSDAI